MVNKDDDILFYFNSGLPFWNMHLFRVKFILKAASTPYCVSY